MGLLDREIVDGVPEKILTFPALLRFGFDNELAIRTVLVSKTSWHQARLRYGRGSLDGYNCIRSYE